MEIIPNSLKRVRTRNNENSKNLQAQKWETKGVQKIMHKIDIKCFGIKYKKVRSPPEKWANKNTKKLKI